MNEPRSESIESRQGPVRPVPAQPRDQLVAALRAVVPFVRKLSGLAWRLAAAAAVGGALLWWALADRAVTGDGRTLGLVLWAAVLLAAPVVLFAVGAALKALAGLPEQVATLPARTAERATELRRLADEVREARRRGTVRSGLAVARLWRGAASARELLELAGPVAFLFNPGTLLAAVIATLVATAEVVAGVIALLVLLAT